MLLSPHEADQFFRIHRSLMCFVNDRLEIVPDVQTPDEFSALPVKGQPQIVRLYRPAHKPSVELRSIRFRDNQGRAQAWDFSGVTP